MRDLVPTGEAVFGRRIPARPDIFGKGVISLNDLRCQKLILLDEFGDKLFEQTENIVAV